MKLDEGIKGNGTWADVRIWRGRSYNKKLCAEHFPVTCEVVQSMPEIWTNPHSHVLLSVLLRDSWVPFHRGLTNSQITYHLPVQVPTEPGAIGQLATIEHGQHVARETKRGQVYFHDDEVTV